MVNQPLVTIIAVCYNQENWVKQALDSIKKQTYPNIQLIVADDGSKDKSKEYIQQWLTENSPNAMFIDHKENLGLTKNLNSAIPYVKGDYFQAFGCDDIMIPTKIEQQVSIMENRKTIGIVYTDMYYINLEGDRIDTSYFEKLAYKKPKSGNLYTDLIDRFIISAPSVLIRRSVLDKLKGYNESLDYEDHDFFLGAAKHFEFLYMPDKTVLYRINEASLSSTVKSINFYRNCFLIFYQNFDPSKEYKASFEKKLLFYTKNLYIHKFKKSSGYFLKAFIKTLNPEFLKYSLASIPFYFK